MTVVDVTKSRSEDQDFATNAPRPERSGSQNLPAVVAAWKSPGAWADRRRSLADGTWTPMRGSVAADLGNALVPDWGRGPVLVALRTVLRRDPVGFLVDRADRTVDDPELGSGDVDRLRTAVVDVLEATVER